jgi:hypothetical protein
MEWLLALEPACATGYLNVEETQARVMSAPLNEKGSLLSAGAILGTHQQTLGALVRGLSGVAEGVARSPCWRDRPRYVCAYGSVFDAETPRTRAPGAERQPPSGDHLCT